MGASRAPIKVENFRVKVYGLAPVGSGRAAGNEIAGAGTVIDGPMDDASSKIESAWIRGDRIPAAGSFCIRTNGGTVRVRRRSVLLALVGGVGLPPDGECGEGTHQITGGSPYQPSGWPNP